MERIIGKGKLIEIVNIDMEIGGALTTIEFARRPPGARLIIPKEDAILITREMRRETGGYDFRLPGGKVFDSLDEYREAVEHGKDIADEARSAAIREAREETGIKVEEISFFHVSVCGATVVWDLYYFVVTDFADGDQELGHGEDIQRVWVTKEEAKKMCMDGRISEERSALTLLRYLARAS